MIKGPTVITGAGRGIGAEIARRIAREGGSLSLWGRNEKTLLTIAEELRPFAEIHTAIVDVSIEEEVKHAMKSTVARFGSVRAVVNNAGVANPGPFEELTTQEWDTLFAVNTRGVMLVTKYALKEMRKMGRGSFVNIVSEVGLLNQANNVAYGASKAAVVSFSKGLALELAPQNIRVNIVAPGPVETDMWNEAVCKRAGAEGMSAEEFRAHVLARIPSGRFTPASDVAEAVAYLLDEERAYSVTGTSLMVTAGSTVC